ncbi:hypothetical protein [Ralstonia solanacearum]|uniref:hypothetical protein n=1 Tax=Ralstonia solanacearum TaxID=305 RepID=UPI000445759A|nr:hypothetical protein [Ralstonia solanacearum]EUJ12262.1 hypothetical protein RSP673_22245 [Ralstonia solanacearum P673]MCL9843556.1 hypothetical protein [Ralstonia solanacearum]MCL9847882.1 hypothetical protein [Ralstonia solanacearum]MCL9852337.1 hypothetical protein [Ralstonia solanacearum]MCL9857468.1 hypothetical protein [Ralstonia solanacearum]
MHDFIDTRSWPIVYLHMPKQVADTDADDRLAEIRALYARAEPFVLLMDGEELPRHSPRFVSTYVQWSRENTAQLHHCVGAIRIEADTALRQAHEAKARAWNGSGHAPYPFLVAAALDDAQTRAQALLAAPDPCPPTAAASRDARRSP